MKSGIVRALAICIIRNGDKILVGEYHDASKGETFYRPLGGAIEFGEKSEQTVEREIAEEVRAQVENLRYCGVIENLFTYDGEKGHEIVLIYQGDLVDKSLYEKVSILGTEDDGSDLKVVWMPLDFFQKGKAPLYPDGVLGLIR